MKASLLTCLGFLLLASNGWTKEPTWFLEYSYSFESKGIKAAGSTRFLPEATVVIPLPKDSFDLARTILTVSPYRDPNKKPEDKEYTHTDFEISTFLPVQSGANTVIGATLYRSFLPLVFGEEIELLRVGEETLRVKIRKNYE